MMLHVLDYSHRWTLDGDPCDVSRLECYHRTVYATNAAIRHLTDPGAADTVRGRLPGEVSAGDVGRCAVVPASAWGARMDSWEHAARDLATMAVLCEAHGVQWSRTGATAAARVWADLAPTAEVHQTPPRWRQLTHAALHPGPMIHLRSYSPWATAYDRRAAYLRALREPLPMRGSYLSLAGMTWDGIVRIMLSSGDRWGVLRATVDTSRCVQADYLPPLPVRRMERDQAGFSQEITVYPRGHVTGVWTVEMVMLACVHGATVVRVHDGYLCRSEPWGEPIADRLGAIPKPLGKLLYTRLWGKLASMGWYIGKRVDGRWTWTHQTRDPLGHIWPTYRPDVACSICGRNAATMLDTLQRQPRYSVVAAHVDCVWVDNTCDWLEADDTWSIKDNGELSFYGVGTYIHDKTWGCQGYPCESRDKLRSAVVERPERKADSWSGGRLWPSDPTRYPTVSEPLEMEVAEPPPSDYGDSWIDTQDSRWGKGGWDESE